MTPKILWTEKSILFTLCLFVRIIVLLTVRTSYVPDEYYQYQEIVSKLLYGTGIVTWEWLRDSRIRSFVPLLPSLLLGHFSKSMGIEYFSVSFVSRFFHTALAVASDYCFIDLVRLLKMEFWALAVLVNLFSWSGLYMLSRSLANSLEYSCLLIGTRLIIRFICRRDYSSLYAALAVMTFSTYIRPTAALFWGPLMLQVLWNYGSLLKDARVLLQGMALAISLVLLFTVIDSAFYGEFTLVPVNFFAINLLENKAVYFGVKPWHFALSEGLPVVLGLYFPFIVLMLAVARQALDKLTTTLLASALSYTILLGMVSSHQEHRFLLPVIPYIHLALVSCAAFLHKTQRRWGALLRAYLCISLAVHALAATYLLLFHQRGGELVMSLLTSKYAPMADRQTHVLLHAPCYSFPGYAHLLPRQAKSSIKLYTPKCFMPWENGPPKDDQHDFKRIWNKLQRERHTGEEVYLVTFDGFFNTTSYPAYGFELVENVSHSHFDFDLDEPRPMRRVTLYRHTHDD